MSISILNGKMTYAEPPHKRLFDQTGVSYDEEFALCAPSNELKQVRFVCNPTTSGAGVLTLQCDVSGDNTINLTSAVGSPTNSFATIQPDLGTSPVATSTNDTLTFRSSDSSVLITGTASNDSINFVNSKVGNLTSSGSFIGINQTSPAGPMHIKSTGASFTDGLTLEGAGVGATRFWQLYPDSSGFLYFRNPGASAYALVFDNQARVGVGTGTPTYQFEVTASSAVTDPTAISSPSFLPVAAVTNTSSTNNNYSAVIFLGGSSSMQPTSMVVGVNETHTSTPTGHLRLLVNSAGTISEGLRLTSDRRLYGTALHNNAGSVTGTTTQYIASGTYTPTLTNVANLDASTAYKCQWTRVGNVVTVSGKVDIDPTLTATSTKLGISLPIASNLVNAEDCSGDAASSGIAGQTAAILADGTNDRAQLQYISADVTNQSMYFIFSYEVL